MEYFIVRRGGHHYYESFLNTTTINAYSGPTDKDFGSFRNAYKFKTAPPAHAHVRGFAEDFQGSVIRTDGRDLYELEEDPRND